MADTMLLRGQRVVPARTRELGYRFKYEHVTEALAAVYGAPGSS
jgi:NAD dependent epimerase/dehydratase family enzyme